ncbi:uncharacterized protein isoform X2 [Leptinotarsa decemlineata]|uniref:uncharacterized protein isoform X2 n=1 Tax=Leptinotarsa decemlineata TaxID=7539 RepID=UPI003D3098DA
MDPVMVYHSKKICHEHFNAKYHSSMSSRLQTMAVPTLFLRDEIDLFNPDQPSTSSTVPLTLVLEPDSSNENAIGCLMSPFQLLKHSGVCKQAITPRKKKLYASVKVFQKTMNNMRNSKKNLSKRLHEAETFKDKYELEHNMEKLNSLAAILIRLQFRESSKCKKLRRFTLDEKLLSVALYRVPNVMHFCQKYSFCQVSQH